MKSENNQVKSSHSDNVSQNPSAVQIDPSLPKYSEYDIKSEQEILELGVDFAVALLYRWQGDTAIVLELIGDVGAGKTTFTRGFAEGLGISAPVTSPSFTISKSYAFSHHDKLCTLTHYDFYRLSSPGLMQSDLSEKLLDPSSIIIIEWGKSIAEVLPKDHFTINITKNEENRIVSIAFPDDKLIPSRPYATNGERNERLSSVTTGAKERVEKVLDLSSVNLFLDTSTPTTILKINDKIYEWSSGRDLAEKLLSFIYEKLYENHYTWSDIKSITFMSGPGSFTGLRIGAAVVNTLAHELSIPLYDHHGASRRIIIPDYGRPANISAPKK